MILRSRCNRFTQPRSSLRTLASSAPNGSSSSRIRGSIAFFGEDVTGQGVRERRAGFVFQHYALFRHLTVFENIAFALRVRRWPADRVRERVRELLHLIRLENLERRMPSELSGGQRQRVALARALAAQPRVLLLDEPFGALDAKVRQELRQGLRRLHDQIHMTSVFVTHDQEEAFEVADKVVVMNAGRIEQVGTPQEVFDRPANAFVMDFLGNVNVFHGRLQNGRVHLGDLEVAYPDYPHAEALPTKMYVRPHELDIRRSVNGTGGLPAKVLHVNPTGSVARVHLLASDFDIAVQVDLTLERYSELDLKPGDQVYVSPRRVRVFLPDDYAI
ncbi:MAG: sulfate/molybdate ABC transporter ATP-binding protein [Planctomycetes bacterium]|nr:sulfate/molybdate ABC transporter ATP-binding protein [Planctomycetota bacterium]